MDQVQFPVFSQCPSTGRTCLRYSFFKNFWPYTLQECMAMYCTVLLPPTSQTKHLCCSPALLLLFVYPHTICCLFNLPTPFCCPLLVPPPLNSSSCVTPLSSSCPLFLQPPALLPCVVPLTPTTRSVFAQVAQQRRLLCNMALRGKEHYYVVKAGCVIPLLFPFGHVAQQIVLLFNMCK